MADGGEPPSRDSLYGGERNNGVGKVRKERKPPSTPYARPPLHRRPNGWISRIVDPAKRLLSDGATRFLPSLFSPSPLSEEIQSEEEHAPEDHNESISANLLAPPSSGGVGASAVAGNSKPDISNTVEVDKRKDSDGALPDIEQLIKGKTFSRKEIDHLMEILRSRVDNVEQEVKAPHLTELQGLERGQTSKGKQKASFTETEEIDRFQLASTPLQRPSLPSEIGASPVDIARAYMGSRASEVGLTSASLSIKNEKWGHTNEFPSKPILASPLPKAPICWPGAVTHNQEGYSTPQNQKSRYGLHSFSRTPYSRTMYTKSKSKLTPVKGDSQRLSNILSTPLQPTETLGFGKSISRLAQGTYGSGGPIRRTRNKSTSAAPAKESPLVPSIHRSPFAKEFNADHMIRKNAEPGNFTKFEPTSSKLQSSEAGIPSVHPHSSKLARQILEHIDRPVTLKEKSKEFKLATSFKNPPSTSLASRVEDSNRGTTGIGVSESVELVSTKLHHQSNGGINGFAHEKTYNVNSHTGADMASGSKVNLNKTSAVSDGDNNSSRNFSKIDSRTRSPEQGTNSNFLNTDRLPSDKTKEVDITLDSSRFEPLNSTHRKPFLPSIAVGKCELRNPFSSDTSATFSFPVTTSTNTYFDLPTPTVVPSSLTSSPQKSNVTDSKITIAPPVYSLPPSTTSNFTDDVGPKFKFGSGKARLSFALEGDDGASSDAPSISYKFGSGKSRLNFGSITSYAVCM